MNKSLNGFRHLSAFGCFVCLVGWGMPTDALAVSAMHNPQVACFAHRAKLKVFWRLGKPCATLLKKDGTEWSIGIISRDKGTLTYYLCDDPEKSPQSISYDAISAVRMPNNALWRPNRSRAPGKDARGYWGVASLSLSIFGLLTASFSLGAILWYCSRLVARNSRLSLYEIQSI